MMRAWILTLLGALSLSTAFAADDWATPYLDGRERPPNVNLRAVPLLDPRQAPPVDPEAKRRLPALRLPAGPPLPKLRVEGGRFVDPAGRIVFLRGVNYSHRTKSQPYYSWQTREHFEQIRAWGFNCVRYLVLWDAIEPERGRIDEQYLRHIEQVLQWAREARVYVLLDMHQDLFSGTFGGDGAPAWASIDDLVEPNEYRTPWFLTYFTREVLASFHRLWNSEDLQKDYARAWSAIARRAAGHPNVVGYDLINEPFPGISIPWWFERRRLTPFYATIGAHVRQADPSAVLFLEPAAITANVGLPTSIKAPGGPAAYAPHYYDLLLELGKPYGRRGWIARRAARVMAKQAREMGAPLFLGEFGVGRGVEGAAAAMEDQTAAFEAVLASGWTLWNYTPEIGADGPIPADSMSLTANGVEHPAMSAFVRPYPRAVAGQPQAMRFDRENRHFELTIEAPRAGEATEIFLPARHFPTFTVETPATWSFDDAERVLSVKAPAGLDELRISVSASRAPGP